MNRKWNNNPRIKAQHNCFSYAINDLSPSRTGKAQPGYFSGHSGVPDHDYKCKHFLKRLKKDMPSMYVTTLQHKCKKDFTKHLWHSMINRILIIIFIDRIQMVLVTQTRTYRCYRFRCIQTKNYCTK